MATAKSAKVTEEIPSTRQFSKASVATKSMSTAVYPQ